MGFYRTSMNGCGIEYGFRFSERMRVAVGVADTLDGVPLKYAVVVDINRPWRVGSFQLHIRRVRVGIMFPVRWKFDCARTRLSFPKMPELMQ